MNNTNKEIVLKFDLKDFSREEIDIDIKDNSISIQAQTKQEKKQEKEDFKSEEKLSKNFSYESSLPEIQKEKSKIDFTNGTLTIILYKK